LISRLVHFLAPAAAASGSQGLPLPDPVEIAAVAGGSRRHAALMAPDGFGPAPDIVAPVCPVPADVLYGLLLRMAADQPRVFLAAAYPSRLQAHYVARSEKRNLPTLIVVEAQPRGADASAPVILARAVYGPAGAGAHRRMLQAWLAALRDLLQSHGQG